MKTAQTVEKENRQIRMFGCTKDELDEFLSDCRNFKMYVMSALSDVQSLNELENKSESTEERIRILLNRVKYVVDTKL